MSHKTAQSNPITKSQKVTLIVCIIFMVLAIILALLTAGFAFYEFMVILAIPILIASAYIAMNDDIKIVTYLVICLSCIGAAVALLASSYWLILLVAFS